MKMKLLGAVGTLLMVSGAASAQTYPATKPPGGLDSTTVVPKAYADGSSGTLGQIGQMADGSVQQTTVGAANGVAPLDANKMMSAPVSGDTSSAPVTTTGTSTGRTLSSRFGDAHNLADYGAKLSGSSADLDTINTIYKGLPDGYVMHIPAGSGWNGVIENPDTAKNLTWIFDGTYDFSGYQHSPGDGDTTLSHKYGLQITRMDTATKNWRQSPLTAFYWNDDSNYCGAYCYNWSQYSPASFSAISGPTSQGNTSPATFSIRSFGNNPSSSYDVGMPVTVFKYGQNSTWGLDVSTNDYSGKSPSAFATWNEFDMWTNGQDIKSWDTTYGTPQAGHRSNHYITVAHETAELHSWAANTSVTAYNQVKGSLSKPYLLNTTASDGIAYVWYPVADATTGSTAPTFPAPAKFVGTLASGTLTVTSVASGAIAAGDYITGASPVTPVKITSQTSGTTGGVGVYVVASSTASSGTNAALYAAPQVTDGTAVWQFGEETNSTVSSIFWVTAAPGDGVDTVLGIDKNVRIDNAVLNTELATMGASGVPIRIGSGQKIDISGSGNAPGQNQHTLSYTGSTLAYAVKGTRVFGVADDGSAMSPNATVAAAGTTISDATQFNGPFTALTATADNAGVKVGDDMGNEGKTERVFNASSYSIYVYPINGNWSFVGHSNGVGILLPAYGSLIITSYSSYNAQLIAEYLPAAP